MKFLCKIGLHKWEQNRELVIKDIHPMFDSNWRTPRRKCICCGYEQCWIPGYGGSELGYWRKAFPDDK